MSEENKDGRRINRRTVLRGASAVSGAALVGTAGVGGVGAKPCFKITKDEFCDGAVGSYVKVEFVEKDDGDCYFETVEDHGNTGFEIDGYHNKGGETCEPIAVEWTNDYDVSKALVYGGGDCNTLTHGEGDPALLENHINAELINDGHQEAAISNIQLCVTDAELEDLNGYQVDLIYGDPVYDFSGGFSYTNEDRLLQAIKSCSSGVIDRVNRNNGAYDQCGVTVTDNLSLDGGSGKASATIKIDGDCSADEFNLVSYAADFGSNCEFENSTQEQFAVDENPTDNGDGKFTFTVEVP